MRLSPHRLPHTTPKPMCDKPSFWMTSNDHFQNKFHLFINQKLFGWYITMIILYSKPCAFLWVADFWCHIADSTNLDTFTAFHRWGLCLTIIDESFTRLANTRHIFSLPFYSIVRLNWTLSHLPSPPNKTPNVVLIYQPCTHTHLMQCPHAYAMQYVIACYIMSHA